MQLEKNEQPKGVSCVIMASGFGRRFGSNKLLADFKGKSLIQHILDQIPFHSFKEVILVTRYEEIKELIIDYPVTCILHDMPRQSDTICLGIAEVSDTIGCMFVTCDQPLRTSKSIELMLSTFEGNQDSIIRLGYQELVGNPVIFPRKYYDELRNLQPGQKGSTVIKAHKDHVIVVEAKHKYELVDVDTQEDLMHLARIAE